MEWVLEHILLLILVLLMQMLVLMLVALIKMIFSSATFACSNSLRVRIEAYIVLKLDSGMLIINRLLLEFILLEVVTTPSTE